MRPRLPSIHPGYYRPGGSWSGRVGRSNLFAWAVSVALHGAVFLGLYQVAFREEVEFRRLIIPEARLAAAAGPIAPQPAVPLKLARKSAPTPAEPTGAPLDELPITAITLDAPPGWVADADRLPDPAASLTAPALASCLAMGPVSSFFGQAGNAYKVAYVVDASASLMIYIDEIVREMRRSIRELVPTQRFHIVLAKPSCVEEFAPRRLVPAIGQYKAQAMDFLDTITGIPPPGKADPIESMKRAFAVRPELIYFLSDGDYPDIQAELLLTLERLNPQKAVKITVIGFDPSPQPRALLERIARHHGGHFRTVEPKS